MNRRADASAAAGIETQKQENILKAKSKRSVYIYIGTLFLIVFFFILLSYFIQQRNNSQLYTLHEKNATAQQNIENLQTTNMQLQAENDAYQAVITDLEAQIAALDDKIEDTRQEWVNDVQSTRAIEQARYNELLTKYNELIETQEVKGNNND